MLENYKVLPSNLVEEHYPNANKLDLKETLKTYDMTRLVEASKEYKRYFESQEYKDLQSKIDNEIEMILKENEAFEKALKEVEFERLNRTKPEVKIEKLTIVDEIFKSELSNEERLNNKDIENLQNEFDLLIKNVGGLER